MYMMNHVKNKFAPPNLGQITSSCDHVSLEIRAPPRLSRLLNGFGPALGGWA